MLKTMPRLVSLLSVLATGFFFLVSIEAQTQEPRLATETEPLSPIALIFIVLMYCCMGIFLAILPILIIASIIIQIYMIIDAIGRDFGDDESLRVVWILVLFFIGFPVGSILYYYMVMQKYPVK